MNNLLKTIKVPLRFNWSFLILPALFFYYYSWVGFIYFALLIFSLLIHEYSHIWMGFRNDVTTKQVSVFALGAAAMMDAEKIIKEHKKELKIALAGPTASLIMGMIFLFLSVIFIHSELVVNYLIYCFVINLLMGVFNLLPVYPMDGGRVLNSLLSMKLGGIKGVKISSTISWILSGIGIVISGYFHQYWILATFIFVIVLTYFQRKVVLKCFENCQ